MTMKSDAFRFTASAEGEPNAGVRSRVLLPRSRTHAAAQVAAAAEIAVLRSLNAQLMREIAVLRGREANAQRLADRDALTGLYNRRRLSELLVQAIAAASRQQHRVGVLFIDLDGFKDVNDQHGHAMGDELLTTVAGRICSRARSGDVIGRYGGDEFVVLLQGVPNRAAALEMAAAIAGRVALPCQLEGEELRVTAAVGVALYPDDGQTAAELLQRADERMYRAKGGAHPRNGAALDPAPRRRRDDASKRSF
jgi:diguanylate cyclase (GGDEF)-like protein